MLHLFLCIVKWCLLLQEELPCNGVFVRIAMVRPLTSDELKHNAAYSPDVGLFRKLPVKQFGSHVSDCTTCI